MPGIEYSILLVGHVTEVAPVIGSGAGIAYTTTVKERTGLFPKVLVAQALTVCMPTAVQSILILLEPLPQTMLPPPESDQLCVMAPGTGSMVYKLSARQDR